MKFWRAVGSLAAGCFLLLAGLESVHSEGEVFDLRHKLAKGDTLTYGYAFSTTTKFLLHSPSVHWADEDRISGPYTVNVKSISGDGTISLEIGRRLQLTKEGRTKDFLSLPSSIQIRPSGEIVSSTSPKKRYFLFRLPEGSIETGASWTYDGYSAIVEVLTAFGGSAENLVTKTLTLMGVERIEDQRVARIRARGEAPYSQDTQIAGVEPARLRIKGTLQITGEILWLVDQGRLQRFTEEASVDTPAQMEFGGQSITGRFSFKSIEQLDTIRSKN